MDKQKEVYPNNEILSGNKEEWRTDTCYNMTESQQHYAKLRQTQEITYFMIPFIWNTHNGQTHRLKVEWWLPRAGMDENED